MINKVKQVISHAKNLTVFMLFSSLSMVKVFAQSTGQDASMQAAYNTSHDMSVGYPMKIAITIGALIALYQWLVRGSFLGVVMAIAGSVIAGQLLNVMLGFSNAAGMLI